MQNLKMVFAHCCYPFLTWVIFCFAFWKNMRYLHDFYNEYFVKMV